ncbi:MAG: protein kinase [Candidatus Krumholzibacteria bacterium]|nr:protein kinase [Candidatus Krumholzibacteria bacterium]
MLRPRQKFGKYTIQRRIAQGGFADVYRAYDNIEGINVAIKLPHRTILVHKTRDDFLREVRLTSKLDHPNILHIKNADFIDGQFVIVYPLGEGTLGDKISNRLSFRSALDYTEQMLDAVAFAHRKRVLHCDIKPENLILFVGNVLKLADFGIAKIATQTMSASGSGTVGYIAPEQALGRPSLRSDVFSMGLIIYQMATNRLPGWPFDWPPPGFDKLKRKAHPDFIALVKRAMSVNARKRYANAAEMLAAFGRVKRKASRQVAKRRSKRPTANGPREWRVVRFKEFRRHFGKVLETHFDCSKCGGPISERMIACPWCGHRTKTFRGETKYPARCRECKRGMKLDWLYCPHEYRAAQGPRREQSYSDRRYVASCSNPACRGPLMPFMKYCPWCRTKVSRKWKIESSAHKCPKCGWGTLKDFWTHCPWCAYKIRK